MSNSDTILLYVVSILILIAMMFLIIWAAKSRIKHRLNIAEGMQRMHEIDHRQQISTYTKVDDEFSDLRRETLKNYKKQLSKYKVKYDSDIETSIDKMLNKTITCKTQSEYNNFNIEDYICSKEFRNRLTFWYVIHKESESIDLSEYNGLELERVLQYKNGGNLGWLVRQKDLPIVITLKYSGLTTVKTITASDIEKAIENNKITFGDEKNE